MKRHNSFKYLFYTDKAMADHPEFVEWSHRQSRSIANHMPSIGILGILFVAFAIVLTGILDAWPAYSPVTFAMIIPFIAIGSGMLYDRNLPLSRIGRVIPLSKNGRVGAGCQEALSMAKKHPDCQAYVDKVLAQGRELFTFDFWHLCDLNAAHEANEWKARTLAAQEKYGSKRSAAQDLELRNYHRQFWIKAIAISAFTLASFHAQSDFFWNIGVTAAPILMVIMCGYILYSIAKIHAFRCVSMQPDHFDERIKAVMAEKAGLEYINQLRAGGSSLLIRDVVAVEDMLLKSKLKTDADACKELHQIASN